jgi:dimethylhistidine N-methyltransferase
VSDPGPPPRDLEPELKRLRDDALAGLRARPKRLPCKYLYDERGSELFERICELEEYYPTRTELGILQRHVDEMARALGPRVLLLEYGSGNGRKTRILLEALDDPVAYVPVDISRDVLLRAAGGLDGRHRGLEVLPVCADFGEPFALPEPAREPRRRALFFPGSTIGNLDPAGVVAFLRRSRALLGRDGAFLIGVDLRKPRRLLEAAYDDREGVTAEFNLNLLRRLNRELGADFDLALFRHRIVVDGARGRVEMHLVSVEAQVVNVGGERFAFRPGESIHTENSYKFTLEGFAALAARAGLEVRRVWQDRRRWFSVQYLVPFRA